MRTSRQWIVVIGGDEIVFHRKDLDSCRPIHIP